MSDKRSSRLKEQSVRSTAYLWLALLGLWLVWSGHFSFTHPLLLGFGIASATGVTYLCRRMGLVDAEMIPLHLTWRTLCYVPWLAWQVILSGVEVLRVGFSRQRLRPYVATIPASQKTSLGLVSYANSITLTPGTLSIDADAGERTIRIHAVSSKTLEGVKSGEMNDWIRWIEGV